MPAHSKAVSAKSAEDKIAPNRCYQINEIFYSLQGEGIRTGTPNVFVRFSGCNLACSRETHGFNCDTEFVSGTKMTGASVIERVQKLAPDCSWVILTGGEPLLQLDLPLCRLLKEAGYRIAVETNGTIDPAPEVLAMLDWIVCSPKVAEHALRLSRCEELKYVRGYGQGIPRPTKLNHCPHKLISPAFDGPNMDQDAVSWCVDLVKKNPEWRLTLQTHKLLMIR